MATTVQEVLSRLEGVRVSGDGWSARCPVHDDTKNSLSVSEGRDGRVLLNCFAGCEHADILAKLGIECAGGYTVEDYADEKRLPVPFLHEIGVRDDEYNSRPCVSIQYPNGKRYRGANGRKWCEKGFKAQLYGSDRLETDDGGAVLLLEGESDAHTAWHLGRAAVGVPGASSWRPEWAELLEGRDVYLWREPDGGGDKLLAAVAADIPSLRVISPSNGDPKDLADLHAKHGSQVLKRLDQLINAAVPAADLIAELDKNTLDSDLREWVRSIAGKDPLARELAVRAKEKELADAGEKQPGRLIKAALKSATRTDDELQGTAVMLSEPEPWPDEVDGGALLDEIVVQVRRFMALPAHAAEAIALWLQFSHTHDVLDISPILAITSPTKRCAKTTLLEFLFTLATKPLAASNVTAAALFRAVERFSPTLLIDEADSFLAGSDELRGILNSGHRRATAQVIRTAGDDYEPRVFRTWCPKAIALITARTPLPDTLADRCIEIRMRRRRKDEPIERWRFNQCLAEFAPLRRKAARRARDHMDELRDADPAVPDELHDRAADNWRPLLAIAALAGGEWPQKAKSAALALSGTADDETEQAGVMVLEDLRGLFRGAERLHSATIVKELAKLEDRPWPEWGRKQNPITARQLARLVQPFGIRPRKVKVDGHSLQGYRIEDCQDAFSRYIPSPDPEPPEPSAEVRHEHGISIRNPGSAGSGSANGDWGQKYATVPEVPDGQGVESGCSAVKAISCPSCGGGMEPGRSICSTCAYFKTASHTPSVAQPQDQEM